MVVLHCETDHETAARRYLARERANPHKRQDVLAAAEDQMRSGAYPWSVFDAFDVGVPALRVDTTHGYEPNLTLSRRLIPTYKATARDLHPT
jgi:hypothetical protein